MKAILIITLFVLSLSISGQTKNTLSREELHQKYKTYADHTYRPLIFHDWLLANKFNIAVDSKTISPGIYLVKSRRNFTYYAICSAIGGGVLIYGADQYRDYYGTNDDGTLFRVVKGKEIRNICLMTTGALWLTGTVFFISAQINLGKAGMALDENGIGINVKF